MFGPSAALHLSWLQAIRRSMPTLLIWKNFSTQSSTRTLRESLRSGRIPSLISSQNVLSRTLENVGVSTSFCLTSSCKMPSRLGTVGCKTMPVGKITEGKTRQITQKQRLQKLFKENLSNFLFTEYYLTK